MENFHKFLSATETPLEVLEGRDHHWYFNPDLTKGAKTILVRVIMEKGHGHDFHRHPGMNEILYFLSGTAEQWVEGERKVLTTGDAVYIDPNMVHATFNIGEGDLEFLAILAPGGGWKDGTIDEYMNLPYSKYRT